VCAVARLCGGRCRLNRLFHRPCVVGFP
jgi:hypothetical protein